MRNARAIILGVIVGLGCSLALDASAAAARRRRKVVMPSAGFISELPARLVAIEARLAKLEAKR